MNYAQLLFPDFSLILFGYLLCRFTALDRSIWQPVENLVYYLLFPVLLFHPKSGSYPATVRRSDGSHGGSGRVILATT